MATTRVSQGGLFGEGKARRLLSPALFATGGTVTTPTVDGKSLRVHQFTSTGTSTLQVIGNGAVSYLIVAGGGGGGNNSGGGGGAGEVLLGITYLTTGSYSIVVGSGGGATAAGSNSTAFGITARAGQGGLSSAQRGGHSGGYRTLSYNGVGGDATSWGGGGGGARGNAPNSGNAGSNPGPGFSIDIVTAGTLVTYGQGGTGIGSSGGGGTAPANTGQGGNGGNGGGGTGGTGGSGVVIVWYENVI